MNWFVIPIGVALVLALTAAAIGPLFVDWTQYRATIEAQAERALGLDVEIGGEAQVRLLPTPWVRLGEVRIGDPDQPLINAASVELDIELTPLLRGELAVRDLALQAPELALRIDADGSIMMPERIAEPALAALFDSDEVRVEEVVVTDGSIVLSDRRTGISHAISQITLTGGARSLAGPFQANGTARVGEVERSVRIAGGSLDADGQVALSVAIAPTRGGLDGAGALGDVVASFEGTLLASTLAPSLAGRLALEGSGGPPWSVAGRLEAGTESLLLTGATLRYGSDLLPLELSGAAVVSFVDDERPTIVLEARQIDLDRIAAALRGAREGTDPTAPVPTREAIALLRSHLAPLGELIATGSQRAGSILAELNVGNLLLGGSLVKDVSIAAQGGATGAIEVETAEALLPGDAEVIASGRLNDGGFVGAIEVSAPQPVLLARWWDGGGFEGFGVDAILAEADVTIGANGIDAERLSLRMGGSSAGGRARFVTTDAATPGGQIAAVNPLLQGEAGETAPGAPEGDGPAPGLLDLSLRAPSLDVADAIDLAALAQELLTRDGDEDATPDIVLDLAVDRLAVGAVEGAALNLDADYRDGTLTIDALSAEAIAGAELFAAGTIGDLTGTPIGRIEGTLAIVEGETFASALGGLLPDDGRMRFIEEVLPRLTPAELSFALEGGSEASASDLAATVSGSLAGTDVTLGLSGSPMQPGWVERPASLRLELQAPSSADLLAQLGLEAEAATASGPARFELAAAGTPAEGLRTELTAALMNAALDYEGTVTYDGTLGHDGRLALQAPSLAPAIATIAPSLPALGAIDLTATVASQAEDDAVLFSDLEGSVAGVAVSGELSASDDTLDGELALGELDALSLGALILGEAAWSAPEGGEPWPSEPFGPTALADADLSIDLALTTDRLRAGPRVLGPAAFGLALSQDALEVADATLAVAAGTAGGSLELRRDGAQAELSGTVELEGIDVAELLGAGAAPLEGTADLEATFASSGYTLSNLLGSLSGEGRASVRDGRFAGLDPKPFALEDVPGSAESLPTEAAVESAFQSHLRGGDFAFDALGASLVIDEGRVRLVDVTMETDAAARLNAGSLDLDAWTLDTEWAFPLANAASDDPSDGAVSLRIEGPVAAPERTIDGAALAAWLSLRRLEAQVEAVEEENETLAEEAEALDGSDDDGAQPPSAPDPADPDDASALEPPRTDGIGELLRTATDPDGTEAARPDDDL